MKVCTLFFRQNALRPWYCVNIAFICMGKQKKLFDLLYCHSFFYCGHQPEDASLRYACTIVNQLKMDE